MDYSEILAAIEAEIEKLRKAKALLEGGPKPKGARTRKNAASKKSSYKTKTTGLTVEGRKRIAEAMKRRWAAAKKSPARRSASRGAKKSGGTEDGGFGFKQD